MKIPKNSSEKIIIFHASTVVIINKSLPNNPKPPNVPLPKLGLSPKDNLYKILTDGIYNFKFHNTTFSSMKKKELQNMINELNNNVIKIPRGTMTKKISKIITNLQSIIDVKADKDKKEFLIKIIEELYQMRLKTLSNISVRDFWTQKLNEVRDQVKNIPDNRKSNTQNPYRITFREFITRYYYKTPIHYDNTRVLDANNKNSSGQKALEKLSIRSNKQYTIKVADIEKYIGFKYYNLIRV